MKVADSYHVSTICKNDRQDPYVDWEYSNYCGQTGLFAFRGGRSAFRPELPPPASRVPDTVNWSGGKLAGIPLIKPPYAFLVAVDLNRATSPGRCHLARAVKRFGSTRGSKG